MLLPLLLAMLVTGIAAFLLGWFSAISIERHALKAVRREKQALDRRLYDIGRWVGENWPDEASAYRLGKTEGYQQGLLHSPELIADAEAINA